MNNKEAILLVFVLIAVAYNVNILATVHYVKQSFFFSSNPQLSAKFT